MPLTVAVQMDPIAGIRIASDSTFALLLEAQARGHRLLHYTPDRLRLRGSRLEAVAEPLEVKDVEGDHARLGEPLLVDLSTVDVVLLRQDPPFDLAYVTTTHLLERIHPRTLVVNDPRGVRDAPEKLFVMDFPDLMPPTLIARDRDAIETFRAEHGEVVMKPLYGFGGAAVFKTGPKDPNFGSLFDLFTATLREPWVIQKFLPAVSRGDKRIILVDGEARGAVNRVPTGDDIRSNMVRGGAAQGTDLTPREREICARIGPEIKRRGLLFVGIDVIDGYLTEINVTSPTGIRAIKRLGGPDLAAAIWDAIEARREADSAEIKRASPLPTWSRG
jgi:glutathione synthase